MSEHLPKWYDEVAITPPNHQKTVQYGKRRYTAINAQYQIDLANRTFGMYGKDWGVEHLNFDVIYGKNSDPFLYTLDALFYYPGGEFEMGVDIHAFDSNNKPVEDVRKKLLTDLTTKALSKIGFNRDVFLGMYDDNKYVTALSPVYTIKPPLSAKRLGDMVDAIDKTNDQAALLQIEGAIEKYGLTDEQQKTLKDAIENKKDLLRPRFER